MKTETTVIPYLKCKYDTTGCLHKVCEDCGPDCFRYDSEKPLIKRLHVEEIKC